MAAFREKSRKWGCHEADSEGTVNLVRALMEDGGMTAFTTAQNQIASYHDEEHIAILGRRTGRCRRLPMPSMTAPFTEPLHLNLSDKL